MTTRTATLNPDVIRTAIADSFRKLSPRVQFRNPVMFVVFVCSVLTTALWLQALGGHGEARAAFILAVALWLWFANFAEAIAEGRGKAQAASLRGARKDVVANKIPSPDRRGEISVGAAHD